MKMLFSWFQKFLIENYCARAKRQTVCASGQWAGVDSAWEQKKLTCCCEIIYPLPCFAYNPIYFAYNLPLLDGTLTFYTRQRGRYAREVTSSAARDDCHLDFDLLYRFPFARLCVLHNIWQFLIFVSPPLLQAATWSASISFSFQILVLLASCPMAQSGQFDLPLAWALVVCVE